MDVVGKIINLFTIIIILDLPFMHGNAIKIIIFIHNGRMSINVVKVSFMILLIFCCTVYRSTSHVVNFIHVMKFIQFIHGIHVLEHNHLHCWLTQLSLLKYTQKYLFHFHKICKIYIFR